MGHEYAKKTLYEEVILLQMVITLTLEQSKVDHMCNRMKNGQCCNESSDKLMKIDMTVDRNQFSQQPVGTNEYSCLFEHENNDE
jgi:hypothetical protein